jgi:plasmid stabilization system protein ParE
MPSSKVTFEDTALQSLRHCRHFLIDNLEMPLDQAHAYTQGLADEAVARLLDHAATYAICRQAAALGINHYRELLIDHYRVVYRLWPESHGVSIYLFAHQRQDFKELLFHYQLLR